MKITSNTSSFMSKMRSLPIALNHVELLRMKTLQSLERRRKVVPCDMTLTQPRNCHLIPTRAWRQLWPMESLQKQPNQKKIEWPHFCFSELYFRLILSWFCLEIPTFYREHRLALYRFNFSLWYFLNFDYYYSFRSFDIHIGQVVQIVHWLVWLFWNIICHFYDLENIGLRE